MSAWRPHKRAKIKNYGIMREEEFPYFYGNIRMTSENLPEMNPNLMDEVSKVLKDVSIFLEEASVLQKKAFEDMVQANEKMLKEISKANKKMLKEVAKAMKKASK